MPLTCICCCSVTQSCLTLCHPMDCRCQASLSFTISWSLLKLMCIESVMPSNYLIFCCPLLLLSSILPSIRVFSNESALLIRWPQFWSFSFGYSPFSEYSALISFRIVWFDHLAVKESSPAPEFKSISSSMLSLLSGPALTSILDY